MTKQSLPAIEGRLKWINTLIQAGYTRFDRADLWLQLTKDVRLLEHIAKQRGFSLMRAHRACLALAIGRRNVALAKACFLLKQCEHTLDCWKFQNRSGVQFKVEVKPGNGPPDGAYFLNNGAQSLNWFEYPEHLPTHR